MNQSGFSICSNFKSFHGSVHQNEFRPKYLKNHKKSLGKKTWKSIRLISMKLVGDTLRNGFHSKNPTDFEDVLPFLSAQVHKLFLKYLDNHLII